VDLDAGGENEADGNDVLVVFTYKTWFWLRKASKAFNVVLFAVIIVCE